MHEQRDAQDGIRDTDDAMLDRRRLLGKAGAVAAVAGAGVAGAVVVGTPAQAAPGDAVTLGTSNDAGTTATTITSATPDPGDPATWAPTLTLANTSAPDSDGVVGAPLRLQPNAQFPGGPAGSFGVNAGGVPYFVPQPDFADYIYTSGTAWSTFPILPARALDTRSDISRVLNPSALDSSGRLKANNQIVIALDEFFDGAVVVFGNLTIVRPTAGGDATIYPGGTARPASSSINFVANQVVANAFVVGLGPETVGGGSNNAVRIFSKSTTHVVLDLTAVGVGAFNQINPEILPASVTRALAAGADAHPRRILRTKPRWASR